MMATKNPSFPAHKIGLTDLANGDMDLPIKIVMVSQGRDIGEVRTTVTGIEAKKQHDLMTPNGVVAGSINFRQWTMIEKPSFMSIIRSGW
jgi:hypothetical protein